MTTMALDLAAVSTDARVTEPLELADQARQLTVTRENKTQAEALILALADAEKRVRAVLDPICDQTHRAWKAATSKRAELLQPIQEAGAYLRQGCSRVQAELEAEARRREAEAAERERQRLQAAAEALADEGDLDAAVDVLEQADQVVLPPVASGAPPRAAGVTYRDNWIPQWVDAQGRPLDAPDVRLIPAEFLKVDEAAVRRVVAAMKDRTRIPGVRAVNRRTPVVAGRR